MLISIDKPETMIIANDPIVFKLAVNSKPIKQKMNSTYVGVEVSSSRNRHQKVCEQANETTRTPGYLGDLV